jgi:hypothetical protein
MFKRIEGIGTRPLLVISSIALVTISAACAESTGPDATGGVDQDTATVLPPTGVTEDDLSPSGIVTETSDGFTVEGSLGMATSETTTITFVDADLRVRKDANGNVTSISGTAEIPPPHERIEFEDPVRANVGFFTGEYLNREGDIGILLDDDTDYFVFDFGLAFQMNIATGETGPDAVKPISVKVPVGGRILMVVDYTDPMYYVYGAQDAIGEAGMGWSFHGRIPFVPNRQVAGLGVFDAKNTRTGALTLKKVFKISGQTVDNRSVEVHLVEEDPYESDVSYSYQQGFNGAVELDLGYKDVFGVGIPLADASGGYLHELSVQGGLGGHAYAAGVTADFSWWPTFLPMKPASQLEVSAFATDQLDYGVEMAGQYAFEFPDGVHGMAGSFSIENERNTWSGQVLGGGDTWGVGGEATKDMSTLYLTPPQALLDALSPDVNDQILPRIEEAEAAWEDLQAATGDYEFELSLRGLRTQLPGIVDDAKAKLSSGISSELENHEGEIYYDGLESHLHAADDAYYSALDNLKAQAQRATDNAQTRTAIEAALRDVASRKIFTTTYRHYIYNPFGPDVLVATVNVSQRIMSDGNANTLINAANNVDRIEETSDIKISMQQIYDEVPDRQLFEEVRDDIQDGFLVMRDIGALGLTVDHSVLPPEFLLYAEIDGTRHEGGPISAMTVAAFLVDLSELMIEALKIN